MTGISAIQPVSTAETFEAWQALMEATLGDAAEPVMQAELTAEPPTVVALPPAPSPQELPRAAATLLALPAAAAPPTEPPVAALRLADAQAAVLPMAPVLMAPLTLQNGPELRWRAQDAAAWRQLFDDAGHEAPAEDEQDAEAPAAWPAEPEADESMPAWAQALLARLREAATAPTSAEALRPALQAWRLGLPVLLASPAGLASLQPGRDAGHWRWRRWPARWRGARPATGERWWAVRVGLSAQGRPRTLRELVSGASLRPGQVSCELRLDDVAPGIAHWTEVLVQAAASPSLRAALGARPSLPWLLCNQALWPQEVPAS